MEYLVHVANLVYLVSYFVRDVLRLRIYTVVGALCLTAYLMLGTAPLWAAAGWNAFFVALNVWWIVRIRRERRRGIRETRSSAGIRKVEEEPRSQTAALRPVRRMAAEAPRARGRPTACPC